MYRSPHPEADPSPKTRAHPHRKEEVERDDAETHPDGAVVGSERDEDLSDTESRERIDEDGGDVHRDEDECEQAEVAVQLVRDQAGPPRCLPTVAKDQPDGDGGREEEVRREPARSRRVPSDRTPGRHAASRTRTGGHGSTVEVVPSS